MVEIKSKMRLICRFDEILLQHYTYFQYIYFFREGILATFNDNARSRKNMRKFPRDKLIIFLIHVAISSLTLTLSATLALDS